MAATVEDFRTRFPQFSDLTEYPDETIQLYLDDAALLYMGTDENRWCNYYDIAQMYLAAHLLTIGTQAEAGDSSSSAGPISSKTAGGVSISYAVNASDKGGSDDFFLTTSYGQQFLIMRNRCFVGVLTANRL